ncbi:MAG TPA: hypothetical protein V6D22_06780 [Candidatus Obscuribacterales bacterium]
MRKQLLKPVPRRTNAILSPNYLSVIDYFHPIVVSIAFDCTLFFAMASLYMIFHPEASSILWMLATQVVCLLAIVDAVGMGTAAAYYHFVWSKTLRDKGPSAFETCLEVPLTQHKAFELALAATTQIKDARISAADDAKGEIQVVSKNPWWQPADTCVDISVAERSGKSQISVATYAALSPRRYRSMMFFWGRKWMPVLSSLDVRRNQQITRKIVDFIELTPDWDYHHTPTPLTQSADQNELLSA